jgi:putative ABC transport system substrate-binding protein
MAIPAKCGTDDLATLLGISVRRVTQLVEKKVLLGEARGSFDTCDSVHRFVAHRETVVAKEHRLGAYGREQAMPVIGLLSGTDRRVSQLDAIWRGLNEAGYVEGHNVAMECRWAEGNLDRLPALAADLVRRQVAVIVAIQSAAAPLAAKAATATIPIVFSIGGDPVKLGLVSSLNRPGGNVTGTSFLYNMLAPKRLELLHELVTSATVIGLLVNPKNPASESETNEAHVAARALGLKIVAENASSDHEIDSAFASLVQQRVDALTFAADAVFNSHRDELIALTTRHAVPTMYFAREFTDAGGLMSYGGDMAHAYRLAGIYAGRILQGEKPADLPAQQATKVELVINLKTTKALGLTLPITLLGRADEVIE